MTGMNEMTNEWSGVVLVSGNRYTNKHCTHDTKINHVKTTS